MWVVLVDISVRISQDVTWLVIVGYELLPILLSTGVFNSRFLLCNGPFTGLCFNISFSNHLKPCVASDGFMLHCLSHLWQIFLSWTQRRWQKWQKWWRGIGVRILNSPLHMALWRTRVQICGWSVPREWTALALTKDDDNDDATPPSSKDDDDPSDGHGDNH